MTGFFEEEVCAKEKEKAVRKKKFVLVPSETGGRIYERGREIPGKAKAAIEYSDYRDNWIVTFFGLMPSVDTLSDARLKKSLSKHFTKKEIDSVLEKKRKRANNSFSRWIAEGIRSGRIKRGSLRKRFARKYGLKKGRKISSRMYSKALKEAKDRGDLKTIRRIALAKTFARINFGSRARKAAAKRRRFMARRAARRVA
jgi:hypothetical protein